MTLLRDYYRFYIEFDFTEMVMVSRNARDNKALKPYTNNVVVDDDDVSVSSFWFRFLFFFMPRSRIWNNMEENQNEAKKTKKSPPSNQSVQSIAIVL